MFSGIVEEVARVSAFDRTAGMLTIESALDHSGTKIGDSVAIEGTCLTVVRNDHGKLSFEVLRETERRTTLGALKPGDEVNLERSLMVGERVHGHFVTGHIDGVLEIAERGEDGPNLRLAVHLPGRDLAKFIVEKGAITLAGVSLTVGNVQSETFEVFLTDHTAGSTTLGRAGAGHRVNFEVDILARYLAGLSEER